LPALVSALPALTPSQLDDLLELHGMVGQRRARRAVVLAAFRHLSRLRRAVLEGVADSDLPERENVLLRGPTGCGKTFMVTLLFEKVLGLPTVVADVTTMTESGFVGSDPSTMLTRLITAAGSLAVAEAGVVCMDEFDKLADAPGRERQLVSRFGVQRSLLKMLEPSSVIDVPLELGVHPWRTERVEFRTGRLLWIAAGAFSDWEARTGSRRRIGFGDDAAGEKARPPAAEYARYGLMREIVGRFGVETAMDPLGRGEMGEILECGLLSRYRRELELDGAELEVEAEVLELLVSRALARGTGARGLRAELADALEEGCYRVYSTRGRNRLLRLYAEKGEILWEVTRLRARRTRTSEAGQVELPEGLEELGAGEDG
jgi:ATP-dependent Clp protease ATP-binding subunit ClpX